MISDNRFDPFNDRLCRNVRNSLTEAFKVAIQDKSLDPVETEARAVLDEGPPPCVSDYVHGRLAAYREVLSTLDANDIAAPIDVALTIWTKGLFFETHEFLETYWLVATGDEKRLLQALIRAAGTYVHLEQGNLKAAERISGKAIAGLTQVGELLAVHTAPQRLIDALKMLDSTPPAFF